MNTAQIWQTVSTSSEATSRLATALGRKLKGGEVIELISDLGGGKTTFVKGLALGVGSKDVVHSPSFTLANQYKGRSLTLHHLDLYRLNQTGVLGDELTELISEPKSVVVVEWPDLVENLLPADRLSIRIYPVNENTRRLEFEYRENLNYLFPLNT